MLADHTGTVPGREDHGRGHARRADFAGSLRAGGHARVRTPQCSTRSAPWCSPPALTTAGRTLRQLDCRCGVVSGGFWVWPPGIEVGLDFAPCPGGGGRPATGQVVGDIVDRAGKATTVGPGFRRSGSAWTWPQAVAVGDGANDIDMLSRGRAEHRLQRQAGGGRLRRHHAQQPFLDPVLFILEHLPGRRSRPPTPPTARCAASAGLTGMSEGRPVRRHQRMHEGAVLAPRDRRALAGHGRRRVLADRDEGATSGRRLILHVNEHTPSWHRGRRRPRPAPPPVPGRAPARVTAVRRLRPQPCARSAPRPRPAGPLRRGCRHLTLEASSSNGCGARARSGGRLDPSAGCRWAARTVPSDEPPDRRGGVRRAAAWIPEALPMTVQFLAYQCL